MEPGLPLPEGTLTLLFTDIEASTRLIHHLGERYSVVLSEHHRLLRAAFQQAGGHEMTNPGDSFFVVFARATEAVEAAVAAQRGLASHAWPLGAEIRVRMGLHTGEPALTINGYIGLDVHRAERICSAGHGGQVLLSQTTRDLVATELPAGVRLLELGSHRLKDLPQPEALFQLVIDGLPLEFPPVRSLDIRPNNLPAPPTPLLGRSEELAALLALLQRDEVRLVTLTGPGGTGKTRLGTQAASELLTDCADGVFFVGLAALTDPALVVAAIAQTLGVREIGGQPLLESLIEYLQPRQMLLVLDNFEQVLPAAPVVAALLARCARLKVLVTSRAALRLRGEKEFPVPPLTLPPRGAGRARAEGPPVTAAAHVATSPEPSSLSQYAAVELFIQRALDVKPDFAVTNENAPAVAEICHRLDGLPLALELAAARVRLLTPQAILSRLGGAPPVDAAGHSPGSPDLQLLTAGARDLPARQQTLRNTIAWSYHLLEEPEQRLFRRLSVFAGGCTLQAAEAVGSAAGDLGIEVLEGLEGLASHSLLRQVEGVEGEARTHMLETVRAYAQECLAATGELEEIGRRHAHYYQALVQEAYPHLTAMKQQEWLRRLDQEHDNLRAALSWFAAAGVGETGQLFAAGLGAFWYYQGHWTEGRERLARLLALPGAASRTWARAMALHWAGWMAHDQSDYPATRALNEECLQIWRELDDRRDIAFALNALGFAALNEGDLKAARASLEESLALHRELGDLRDLDPALVGLGHIAVYLGDFESAGAYYREAHAVRRERIGEAGSSFLLICLGDLAYWQGDLKEARSLLEQCLSLCQQSGYQRARTARALRSLGAVLLAEGRYDDAQVALEESLAGIQERSPDVAEPLFALGVLALSRKDFIRARAHLTEALALWRTQRRRLEYAECLESLAGVEMGEERPVQAARLLAAAAALREELGAPLFPIHRPMIEGYLAAIRAALGEEQFAVAWSDGQALSLEQALDSALEPRKV